MRQAQDSAGGSDVQLADDAAVADWQSVAAAVLRIQQRVDAALERAGVPPQWLPVLHRLLQADDHRLAMSRLAREASMTSGGFTKLADRMARDGVIDRRSSSDDRRVVHAALTDAGVATAELATRVYRQTLQANVLDAISRNDLAVAAGSMRALSAFGDDIDAAAFTIDEPGAGDGLRRRRGDSR